MTATETVPNGSRYARCIQSSKRVRWDIDEDVIRGAASMPPTNFCRTGYRLWARSRPFRPMKGGS